jgi:hypothetical protein
VRAGRAVTGDRRCCVPSSWAMCLCCVWPLRVHVQYRRATSSAASGERAVHGRDASGWLRDQLCSLLTTRTQATGHGSTAALHEQTRAPLQSIARLPSVTTRSAESRPSLHVPPLSSLFPASAWKCCYDSLAGGDAVSCSRCRPALHSRLLVLPRRASVASKAS